VRRLAWTPKQEWPRFDRDRLRRLLEAARRKDPRWTVAVVAACAELSHSTLYQYLRPERKGRRPPPEPTLTGAVRLCLVLGEALGKPLSPEGLVKGPRRSRSGRIFPAPRAGR
jgi:hypothetical protein